MGIQEDLIKLNICLFQLKTTTKYAIKSETVLIKNLILTQPTMKNIK